MWSSQSLIATVLLSLVLALFLVSCAGPESSSNEPEEGSDAELQFEGTVRYLQLEGGAWVIESTDGTTYDPTNLPDEYKEEGLPVRVWADRQEDAVSIRMVGPIISIERIERR